MTINGSTRDRLDRNLARGLDGGLEKTFLVEAGAGTGKTTVLVDRLLALVRSGIGIARVVAITFTEKAAGELRVRLRSELERAAAATDDQGRHVTQTALQEIDRAHVSTIHGFCASLLRERPVEAAVDPNFQVADEIRRDVILESVWDAWLRAELDRGLPPDAARAHSLGFGLAKVRELAFKLVEYRDLLPFVPEPTEEGDVEALALDIEQEAPEFLRLMHEGCRSPDDSALAPIRRFAVQAASLAVVPAELRGFQALTRVRPAPTQREGNKKNWVPEVLDDLRKRAGALIERQRDLRRRAAHNAAVGLVRWLSGFVEAYETEKARLGLLDYHDLLVRTRDLVKLNTEVREYFKRAYDRILVDEFQDTDPLQCEIVFFLAEKKGGSARDWRQVDLEPGKLFLVGDPKQSIYRFRRADIEIYEKAKEIIERDGRVLTLSENFRTRPLIVEELNAVFSQVIRAPAEEQKYQPDYEPLVAHRSPDGAGPGIVVVCPDEPPADGESTRDLRSAEASAVADLIAHALEKKTIQVFDRDLGEWRAIGLSDVAILFHRTTGLDAYESALESRGLNYRIAGGKRFYVRREVKELTTVLTAVEDPHNETAVVGALRTPFLGVSDDAIVLHRKAAGTLNYLKSGSSGVAEVDEAFELLRRLHVDRDRSGITRLVRNLFHETGALELYLLKPDGEQRHANLLKVVELARALEDAEPMSLGGFVRWLRRVAQLTPEEAESPLSEEGDQFIRMLTIHKAKGLEFPVVVLADLANHRDRGDTIVVDRGAERLELGVGSRGARLATLGFDELAELEKRRREAETVRLLYVGTTRARDLLIVPWFAKGGDGGGSGLLKLLAPLRTRAATVGQGTAPTIGREAVVLHRAPPPAAGPTRRAVRLGLAEIEAVDVSTSRAHEELADWEEWRLKFAASHEAPRSVATPSEHLAPLREPRRPAGPGSAGPPRVARDLGTLVHDVLEVIDFAQPDQAKRLARAFARTHGLSPETADEAASLVRNALSSAVIARALAARRLWREAPFALDHRGTIVEGRIDLLFEEDDGLVIVDYKTDRFEPGGLAGLAELYRPQLEAYAAAVTLIASRPVKEVVLLFARGPEEVGRRPDPGRTRLMLDELTASVRPAGV